MKINISKEMAQAVISALRYDQRKRGERSYNNNGFRLYPVEDEHRVTTSEALEFFSELLKGE